MQVDFYQLSRDPVEAAVAAIAAKALPAGQRLLVVAQDAALLARVGDALWAYRKDGFLPNAMAGGEHDARQPVLLASEFGTELGAANGARIVVFADGVWRECEGFARALLFFDDARVSEARELWRRLGADAAIQRQFWKQEGGRWLKAG